MFKLPGLLRVTVHLQEETLQLQFIYPGPLDINVTNGATLTIEATGNGSCAPVTAETLLTIEKNVEVNAGPDGNMCEGPNQIQNASANNADTILWTTLVMVPLVMMEL